MTCDADIVKFAPIERFGADSDILKLYPEAKTVIGLAFRVLRGSLRGVAEGTTYLASEGTAFFTYQENLMGTGMNETFFVLLDQTIDNVENVEFNNLLVYPNPTTGVLNISDKLSDVEVFDITGHKVFAQSVVENQINLSNLEKGNYLVVAKQNGKVVKSKIIIL